MDLVEVMDELGMALSLVPGLRVKPYTERKIVPPVAVVSLPRIYPFDATFGRGADEMELPVVVFVGQVDAESSRNALGAYVAGSGAQSVKEAIERHTTDTYSIAHVVDVQFLITVMARIEYLTATFRVRVIGPGKE